MKKGSLDVAIVGAGFAGIAAGIRLRELGISAQIFESGQEVGGRVSSGQVDGYILDRGFQLINLAYPALQKYYRPDHFHHLDKSLDLVMGDRLIQLGDPRNDFGNIIRGLYPQVGMVGEKIRFLRYLQKITPKNYAKNFEEDSSFESVMESEKIGLFYSRIIRPFMQGVFLTSPDRISHRIAAELIQFFIKGEPGLPVGGVGKVSQELSKDLEINFGSKVSEVGLNYVKIGRKKISTKAIIVATDPITSLQLIGQSLKKKDNERLTVEMVGATTWYFTTDDFDASSRLRIDGSGGGPCINSIAISKLAPEYAPAGKILISATVLSSMGEDVSPVRVREHLRKIWHRDTSHWDLIAQYWLPHSLPLFSPGPRSSGEGGSGFINKNTVLAGDYLTAPSQQGALQSGMRAAEQVADLLAS